MRRTGFVLIAVVVVVAAAILVATGAIFAARGATVSARAADLERRLRDAALDGVAVAAERLRADRVRLLAGGDPADDAMLVEVADGARRLEVRLVPQWSGKPFASEAAKLDVNLAPPDALARLSDALGDASGSIVDGIAAMRPVSSVDSIAASAGGGAGPELVLGPLRLIGVEREDFDDSTDASRRRELVPPLLDLLTAHGAEPLVNAEGDPKLDLLAVFAEGSGRMSAASLAEFEDAEREALASLARAKPDDARDDGAIARALLSRGVAPERVDAILGSCTLEAGTHGSPRIDIVRADRRVLAAIDGIGPDLAARIIDLRDSLDEAERRGTAWLVGRRVLTPEQYAAVAGRVTHRSALWRFRVEARIAAPEEAGSAPVDGEPRATGAFDCIVDIAPEHPRIVFLRDVTLLPTARALALVIAPPAESAGEQADADAPEQGPAQERAADFDFRAPEATIREPSVEAPSRPLVAPTGRDVPKSR